MSSFSTFLYIHLKEIQRDRERERERTRFPTVFCTHTSRIEKNTIKKNRKCFFAISLFTFKSAQLPLVLCLVLLLLTRQIFLPCCFHIERYRNFTFLREPLLRHGYFYFIILFRWYVWCVLFFSLPQSFSPFIPFVLLWLSLMYPLYPRNFLFFSSSFSTTWLTSLVFVWKARAILWRHHRYLMQKRANNRQTSISNLTPGVGERVRGRETLIQSVHEG